MLGVTIAYSRKNKKQVFIIGLTVLVLVQFILVLVLAISVCNLKNNFEEVTQYNNTRMNQIYSQTYMINNRLYQALDK